MLRTLSPRLPKCRPSSTAVWTCNALATNHAVRTGRTVAAIRWRLWLIGGLHQWTPRQIAGRRLPRRGQLLFPAANTFQLLPWRSPDRGPGNRSHGVATVMGVKGGSASAAGEPPASCWRFMGPRSAAAWRAGRVQLRNPARLRRD